MDLIYSLSYTLYDLIIIDVEVIDMLIYYKFFLTQLDTCYDVYSMFNVVILFPH